MLQAANVRLVTVEEDHKVQLQRLTDEHEARVKALKSQHEAEVKRLTDELQVRLRCCCVDGRHNHNTAHVAMSAVLR